MISILMHMKQRKHIQAPGFSVCQQHFFSNAALKSRTEVMMIMKAQSWPPVWDGSVVWGNPKPEFPHQPGIQIRQQQIWTTLTKGGREWVMKKGNGPEACVRCRVEMCRMCVYVCVCFFRRCLRDACSQDDLRNASTVMNRGRHRIQYNCIYSKVDHNGCFVHFSVIGRMLVLYVHVPWVS